MSEFAYDFIEDPPGEFRMEINERDGDLLVLGWSDPMSRFEAEELMHQMVFVLGYKLAN